MINFLNLISSTCSLLLVMFGSIYIFVGDAEYINDGKGGVYEGLSDSYLRNSEITIVVSALLWVVTKLIKRKILSQSDVKEATSTSSE